MQQVADIGEHIEDEKRKQLILIFLTAFLLILPGVGEALDALVDIALISRIITLIGDVGNAALTVYDIVDDPKSVPLAIFGLLLGGVASRSEKSFSDAVFRGTAPGTDGRHHLSFHVLLGYVIY